MSPFRLLMLTLYFEPDTAVNAVILSALARELARRGHEVTVVTSFPHYHRASLPPDYRGKFWTRGREDGVLVQRAWVHATAADDKRGRVVNYLSFDVMGGLSALAAPGRYDVVMSSSPPLTLGVTGYLARLLKGRSFVYNIQDLWPGSLLASGFLKPGLVSRTLELMERFVYNRANRLTVLADEVRDGLIARGVPARKITVIPNFADTEGIVPLARRNGFRERIGLGDEFVVMYAGALAYRFGLDGLLEAAARMDGDNGVRFVVVGEGPLERSLHEQAASAGLRNVLFVPFQPIAELAQVLAAADVSVIPFHRGAASASVPSKMYSIMASGRPILAMAEADTGTAGAIRRSGCGVCLEPGDVDGLVSAIHELREDPVRREEMGRNGRLYVTGEHSLAAVADRYEALFLELARRTG